MPREPFNDVTLAEALNVLYAARDIFNQETSLQSKLDEAWCEEQIKVLLQIGDKVRKRRIRSEATP